jgi:hypothetical protein
MKFAIVKSAAPLLNTHEFNAVFKHPLPLTTEGLLKAVETIATAGTSLALIKKCSEYIYQVQTSDYLKDPLFTDARFLTFTNNEKKAPLKLCPTPNLLLKRLEDLIGTPYVWGGNWSDGIPELLEFYPPPYSLDPFSQKKWTLTGVDCSGLLHQVTEGFTPRNTAQLIHFGNPVLIEGLSVEAIAKQLLPLDLIVWVGHVIIVLNRTTTIESSASKGGVVTSDLHGRLSQLFETKSPQNNWSDTGSFVIRRHHSFFS